MRDDRHKKNRQKIYELSTAMYNFDEADVRGVMKELTLEDTTFRMCYPFSDIVGAEDFYDEVYEPLLESIPDLERRDYIVIAGETEEGDDWVGCAGYYTGNFQASWLDIPPTGKQVAMRFHEFYRFQDAKATEFQAIWDIPELMMQANAWPMAPGLGREWRTPSPATQDGLIRGAHDEDEGIKARGRVIEMLQHMKRHPSEGGPEMMELEKFWHRKMNWYGPAGIGTGRGFAGFRNWHQIPFLNAMPDRGRYVDEINYHFFGEKNYAGVTGWPNMKQTITRDGWLGIAPTNKCITMRSLDFWRLENGLIRENWVLVDLLDMYQQIGVDVFGRLREFNKARNMGKIIPPDDVTRAKRA